ncbi:hypothetical protein AQUCO_00200129v1 [Aquilegia coerulea]|uniref:F-box associated beta-propeller type 3 domain-containing protein n=1 Tax=Aquilegia coerulea TaxID=218851 RepID=A0A2G5F1Q5_AQUCA|nr:hypothetical protein AQUCO_00200129v1 [Aquilegia coerulea]
MVQKKVKRGYSYGEEDQENQSICSFHILSDTVVHKKAKKEYCDELKLSLMKCPSEIIFGHILPSLPIEGLIQCTSLCKNWYKLIKQPVFMDMQLQKAMYQPRRILLVPIPLMADINFPRMRDIQKLPRMRDIKKLPTKYLVLVDKVEGKWKGRVIPVTNSKRNSVYAWTHNFTIVDTCNGLLCLTSPCSITIYNPITRECVNIAKSEENHSDRFYVYGFGFDIVSKKYKVVQVSIKMCRGYQSSGNIGDIIKGEIITLGEGSWRKLVFPCLIKADDRSKPVLLDGAFHWIIDKLSHSSGLERNSCIRHCN